MSRPRPTARTALTAFFVPGHLPAPLSRLGRQAAELLSSASVFVTPGSGSERNVVRAGFRLAGLRLTFTRRS